MTFYATLYKHLNVHIPCRKHHRIFARYLLSKIGVKLFFSQQESLCTLAKSTDSLTKRYVIYCMQNKTSTNNNRIIGEEFAFWSRVNYHSLYKCKDGYRRIKVCCCFTDWLVQVTVGDECGASQRAVWSCSL